MHVITLVIIIEDVVNIAKPCTPHNSFVCQVTKMSLILYFMSLNL